jgi:hypothetical protein
MIKLDSTLKSLEIVLEGAVTTTQLDYAVAYTDVLQTTMEVTGLGESDGVTNNTTPVTIAAAPAASTTRKIDFISVTNIDTVVAILLLKLNNNGTRRRICRVELDPGDNFQFTG